MYRAVNSYHEVWTDAHNSSDRWHTKLICAGNYTVVGTCINECIGCWTSRSMLLERSETEQGSSNHFVSATQMQQSPVTYEIHLNMDTTAVKGLPDTVTALLKSSRARRYMDRAVS